MGKSPIGRYPGHSAVIDPTGKAVSSSAENKEDIIISEIDFDYVTRVRKEFPVLKDRML